MLRIEKLSEETLKTCIETWFPGSSPAKKRIRVDSKTFIIDWYIEFDGYKIAFEFDGPTHYCRTTTQLRDIRVKEFCKLNDIILIRFPFYIQPTTDVLIDLFGEALFNDFKMRDKVEVVYPSGFIDDGCVLPGDFNSHGYNLFRKEYTEYHKTYSKIVHDATQKYSETEFFGIRTYS